MPYKDKELLKEYRKLYREKNKEALKAKAKLSREINRDRNKSYLEQYRKTPKGKYIEQRSQAKSRGIPWEISFEDWYSFWITSGHWEERGSGKYMMCRHNDVGAYKIGNIRIDTSYGNNRERFNRESLSKA